MPRRVRGLGRPSHGCEDRAMSAPLDLPAVVRRAFDVSRRAGYVSFCRNETGRLLATLAATRAVALVSVSIAVADDGSAAELPA